MVWPTLGSRTAKEQEQERLIIFVTSEENKLAKLFEKVKVDVLEHSVVIKYMTLVTSVITVL